MISEEERIELLQVIFGFMKTFRPYLTESEFLHNHRSQVEIELLNDEINLVNDKNVKPSDIRWLFSLQSLSLTTEIGNLPVSRENYSFDEALKLFENISLETLTELSDEALNSYFEAYSIAQGEFTLADVREVYISYGGGNIEDLEAYQTNRFKYMKEQLLELCEWDFDDFIKGLIAIEFTESDSRALECALDNYMTTDQPLINSRLFKGDD